MTLKLTKKEWERVESVRNALLPGRRITRERKLLFVMNVLRHYKYECQWAMVTGFQWRKLDWDRLNEMFDEREFLKIRSEVRSQAERLRLREMSMLSAWNDRETYILMRGRGTREKFLPSFVLKEAKRVVKRPA